MKYLFVIITFFGLMQSGVAQKIVQLQDLSAFKSAGKTWKMAGLVTADLNKPNVLNTSAGDSRILVNLPDQKTHGQDLFTIEEYGDMDVELDFMMARGSNSGVYLHGRYEIQLEDSWTVVNPTSGKNGGIYERWDEQRPNGQKGYEGHPPRLNASRAPGLWQHMKISFQAPRFDATGKKIQSAKILNVTLNGVLIHEDVELSGPTRGGAGDEKATGPLRFQGDHGAVAFRNITITDFGSSRPMPEDDQPYRVYPIFVKGDDYPVFRSFMDLPDGNRVIHAVSASSEEKVHYTYDMDTGSIIQVWRGDFLDATPMWHSRGDGSSRPVGAVQTFGTPLPAICRLPSPQAPWKADTTGTGFRPKGYVVDQNDNPVFKYVAHGVTVSDATDALSSGEGITRQISLSGPAENFYFRLAGGTTINAVGKNLYVVDDNAYYLRIDNAGGAEPVIRNENGKKALVVPIARELKYTILF